MDLDRLKNLAGLEEAALHVMKDGKRFEKDSEGQEHRDATAAAVKDARAKGQKFSRYGTMKTDDKEELRKYKTSDVEGHSDYKKESLDVDRALTIAGFESEPIIESVEEDADTFIVFEAKGSPTVIGVFRSAEDAKSMMKKYKKAVGKGFKAQ